MAICSISTSGLTEFIEASHHILEHIEIISFSGFDDAVENRTGICARGGLAKQPVFSAYQERFNRVLSAIIIDIQ